MTGEIDRVNSERNERALRCYSKHGSFITGRDFYMKYKSDKLLKIHLFGTDLKHFFHQGKKFAV